MTCYYDGLLTQNGVKEKITNHCVTTKLQFMPYASAEVHTFYNGENHKNLIVLQSYSTLVAAYDCENRKIYCNGTYSQTTRKHISAFAKQINS